MNRLHATPDTTFPQQSIAWPSKTYTPSFFKGHSLHTEIHTGSLREPHHADWVTGVLIIFFMLLAWTQFLYGKRVKQIFLAPHSIRFLSQLTREGNLFKERVAVALGIVYLFSLPLLIIQINTILFKGTKSDVDQLKLFFGAAAFLLLYWLVKISLIRFLGFVFNTKTTTREYLLNILIFSLITGIVLLPFLVVINYTHSFFVLVAALSVVAILFLYRLVKGFFIGITLTKFSYLFLFVYLCALEILPLLVIIKLLLNYLNSLSL
jgi:hypothetical protein